MRSDTSCSYFSRAGTSHKRALVIFKTLLAAGVPANVTYIRALYGSYPPQPPQVLLLPGDELNPPEHSGPILITRNTYVHGASDRWPSLTHAILLAPKHDLEDLPEYISTLHETVFRRIKTKNNTRERWELLQSCLDETLLQAVLMEPLALQALLSFQREILLNLPLDDRYDLVKLLIPCAHWALASFRREMWAHPRPNMLVGKRMLTTTLETLTSHFEAMFQEDPSVFDILAYEDETRSLKARFKMWFEDKEPTNFLLFDDRRKTAQSVMFYQFPKKQKKKIK